MIKLSIVVFLAGLFEIGCLGGRSELHPSDLALRERYAANSQSFRQLVTLIRESKFVEHLPMGSARPTMEQEKTFIQIRSLLSDLDISPPPPTDFTLGSDNLIFITSWTKESQKGYLYTNNPNFDVVGSLDSVSLPPYGIARSKINDTWYLIIISGVEYQTGGLTSRSS